MTETTAHIHHPILAPTKTSCSRHHTLRRMRSQDHITMQPSSEEKCLANDEHPAHGRRRSTGDLSQDMGDLLLEQTELCIKDDLSTSLAVSEKLSSPSKEHVRFSDQVEVKRISKLRRSIIADIFWTEKELANMRQSFIRRSQKKLSCDLDGSSNNSVSSRRTQRKRSKANPSARCSKKPCSSTLGPFEGLIAEVNSMFLFKWLLVPVQCLIVTILIALLLSA